MKKIQDIQPPSQVGLSRLGNSALASWFKDPDNFDPEEFAEVVRESMYQVNGPDAVIDEHLIAMMADQMQSYMVATSALRTEPLVERAVNGTRMVNPNYRLRDSCLTRLLQLITMAGLAPNGRPKKAKEPTEIDTLLAGPTY